MTSTPVPLLPTTERSLLHRIAVGQSEGRTPSLVGAVARGGRLVWADAWGDVASATDTQYRVGSITKTFTAVLVMRLRDEGLLDLDDPLEKHLPDTGVGDVTIAQLLSHTAGLAAEPPAPWWERTPGELRPDLPDVLGEHPLVHPSGRVHHYSNTGYTLLGSLVSAVRGVSWEEALRTEILEPLDMRRTTSQPVVPYAEGWAVHPWADVLLPESVEDLGLMAPAGQLWSTAADLCRFASFLAGGDERVLSADSVREMCTPAAPPAAENWDGGYGLGVQLVRQDGRTLVGHSGSIPGFVAGLWLSVDDDVAAVVLANATSGPHPGVLAADLVRIVAEAEPRFPEPWRPLPESDAAPLSLTGSWYWGTYAYGLKVLADGGVELQPLRGAGRGSRFRPLPDGTWLGLDGYYDGEVLRVVRRKDGSVSHLDLGSFVFTREPYGPEDVIPGGVDEGGWRGTP
ncbi:beta-lactamase family protein [Streptomyces somaliensis DSM 40738]|uniref:Beta-lactamase family protein n=1 Tax=Streptomyces somaliensis (strain ATCC 33201 / DSM 40738 / JCM 12659 / KCTC 9044 / NCTC 11332 / NRRL B-12077 / IP 733) TaxID=1134445 RepID=A0AA44DBF5_STRE0|nr:serine hydrolase domain-containing protein [Streptomyces somaliensis]MCQ0024708.1 beta-lactamase family protein [Streptomyces somaliensis DSM 40738]NKY13181.1 beta-lactamase family protein [Streptomyces somaliensis DSM 40738]